MAVTELYLGGVSLGSELVWNDGGVGHGRLIPAPMHSGALTGTLTSRVNGLKRRVKPL